MVRLPGHQMRALPRTMAVLCTFAPKARSTAPRQRHRKDGVHAASTSQLACQIRRRIRCPNVKVAPPSMGLDEALRPLIGMGEFCCDATDIAIILYENCGRPALRCGGMGR